MQKAELQYYQKEHHKHFIYQGMNIVFITILQIMILFIFILS